MAELFNQSGDQPIAGGPASTLVQPTADAPNSARVRERLLSAYQGNEHVACQAALRELLERTAEGEHVVWEALGMHAAANGQALSIATAGILDPNARAAITKGHERGQMLKREYAERIENERVMAENKITAAKDRAVSAAAVLHKVSVALTMLDTQRRDPNYGPEAELKLQAWCADVLAAAYHVVPKDASAIRFATDLLVENGYAIKKLPK
jgi:hypothetical protein